MQCRYAIHPADAVPALFFAFTVIDVEEVAGSIAQISSELSVVQVQVGVAEKVPVARVKAQAPDEILPTELTQLPD